MENGLLITNSKLNRLNLLKEFFDERDIWCYVQGEYLKFTHLPHLGWFDDNGGFWMEGREIKQPSNWSWQYIENIANPEFFQKLLLSFSCTTRPIRSAFLRNSEIPFVDE